MTSGGSRPSVDHDEEIQRLEATLQATQRRLRELKGNALTPDGAGQPSSGKLAQQAAQPERLLSRALAAMSDFAQIFDRAGRLVLANQPVLNLWGRSLAEVVGKNLPELGYPAELAERVQRQLQEVFATRQSIRDELTYTTPTGSKGYFEYIFSPIFSSDGEVEFVVGAAREVTERKQSEEALRASQANLAAAQRIAHFGSWEFDITSAGDLDDRAVRWSDEMYRIAGYEPGAVNATNGLFFSLVPPEEHAHIRRAIIRAVRAHRSFSIFHRIVRPNGDTRVVTEQGQVFRDEKTGAIRVVGTAHDITERRKAEDDLGRSELEQRLLAQQLQLERARLVEAQAVAKVGSWETDLSTLEVIWSEETYRVFDTTPETFRPTHQGYLQLVHPDDRAMVADAFLQTLSQEARSIEHRILTTNDSIKFVEGHWRTIFSEDGRPIRVQGTCQDITERKLAIEALRISEKKYKALFEQAAVGVAQTDASTGKFVQINQRFCHMVGRTRAEMENLTFTDITHAGDAVRGLEIMTQIKEGLAREFTCEKRFLRKDGSEVWANVTVSAMWAPGEQPDFFLAVAQDITERKRWEDQFRQAQKLEAIGTLAGGIAHDFNNILAAIQGYTELSRMMLNDQPEVQAYLATVLQASGRATDLVRQILTFSRQQPLERRPMQLIPVVAESLMLLRATIPSTIEFETSLTDAPAVLADATQIHQILMNLGTNAWHAMKGRPGRLKVTLERCVVDAALASTQSRLRPGVYARVSVGDTGDGIEEANLRRIFEPFFTTKAPGQGTGLGLAVVHGIMDTHEGAITVYSRPGEGTVFHLYFPAHGGDGHLAAPETDAVSRGYGQRILFVDDEELLIELGRKALTALGYEVECASDPAVALAMVQAQPDRFALVITDQTMPRMTGLALAGQLQSIRPGLPMILTTGYSQSLTSEKVEAAGLRQLLLKPFTIHSLGSAVQAALSPLPRARHVYGSHPPY